MAIHFGYRTISKTQLQTRYFNILELNSPPQPLSLRVPKEISKHIEFFSLFFTTGILEIIVANINAYAEQQRKASNSKRCWKPLLVKSFHIWLAFLIYFGVYKIEGVSHWKKMRKNHRIPYYMSHKSYKNILRYFHATSPSIDTDADLWYMKLSPLYEYIRKVCKYYVYPPQNVSIDEIMVHLFGRSTHTIRAKHKPINRATRRGLLV